MKDISNEPIELTEAEVKAVSGGAGTGYYDHYDNIESFLGNDQGNGLRSGGKRSPARRPPGS